MPLRCALAIIIPLLCFPTCLGQKLDTLHFTDDSYAITNFYSEKLDSVYKLCNGTAEISEETIYNIIPATPEEFQFFWQIDDKEKRWRCITLNNVIFSEAILKGENAYIKRYVGELKWVDSQTKVLYNFIARLKIKYPFKVKKSIKQQFDKQKAKDILAILRDYTQKIKKQDRYVKVEVVE